MIHVDTLRSMMKYSDCANAALLAASEPLGDAQLDQPFDMGVGSLRRTLLHIYNGEHVWLNRWQGRRETPWPSESEMAVVRDLTERFRATWRERDAYIAGLTDAALAQTVVYRDSKGSLFSATLSDMTMQMFVHSAHHRAQAANMIRRVGGSLPDLDYMYWVRRPA